MKKIGFLTILGILIFFTHTYSQPATTLHFVGGYAIAMGDMKGDFGPTQATFTVNSDSNTYFLHNGFTFGMDLKFAPYTRHKGFKIIGGIHYNSFSQGAEYGDSTGSVVIDYGMRIFSITIGVDLSYETKTSKINPFVNAQFTTNFFSGNYDETYSDGNTTNLTLKSATRFGLKFGGGLDIPLGRRLGAVLGFNYNMANLLGKESSADFGTQYNLNDKEGTVNNKKWDNRSINFLNIYAGFTLYLGL
jgi:hypothetical protein